MPGVDAVARTAAGELSYVGAATSPRGTFAERVAVRLTLPLPAAADPAVIAAGMNPGMSSWLPLSTHLPDPADSCVLILGATGSAGRLAVQNCRARNVPRIVAAGRDAERLARTADLGATATTMLDPDALAAAVSEHQPDLVLDFLWGEPAQTTLSALGSRSPTAFARLVTYVEIGSAAGATASIPAAVLRSRAVTVLGSGAGSVDPSVLMPAATEYAALLASGQVEVDVASYLPDDVAAAWADTSSEHRPVLRFRD